MSSPRPIGSQRGYTHSMSPTVANRLWAKVRLTNGCWIWTGASVPKGYGKIFSDGRYLYTHRVAWELSHGPIAAGMVVMHQCDNPACVRVEHLRLGTVTENNRDMARKGHYLSKFSPEQALAVRTAVAGGESMRSVARRHGVYLQVVIRAARGLGQGLPDVRRPRGQGN